MKLKFWSAVLVSLPLVGCVTDDSDPYALKVLMIGNSFSQSCARQLPQVAEDRGLALELGSLYIGGCSLKRHWENVGKAADASFLPYQFTWVRRGKTEKYQTNIPQALKLCKWDVVTLQQASPDSWRAETYHPYGDELVKLIRELAPQAKIVVQETWSYTPFSPRLAKWGFDQNEMYARLQAAYAGFAAQYGFEIIPMGKAVQEWRQRYPVRYTDHSFGGDVVGGGRQQESDQFKRNYQGEWEVNCDTTHLNERGEYFQALVWASKLFNEDLGDIEYRPKSVTDEDLRLMLKIVDSL